MSPAHPPLRALSIADPSHPPNGSACARSAVVSAVVIFALAVLALIIGPVHFGTTSVRPLPAAVDRETALGHGAFRPDAVFPTTEAHLRPAGIATRGSWLGSDSTTGVQETAWYRTKGKFSVLVAGYPGTADNRLEIELRDRAGSIRTVKYTGSSPRESWQPWFIDPPAGTEAVRIRAVDGSTSAGGWLAFSEPYTIRCPLDWQALAWLQLLATTSLAITLLYGSGLAWLAKKTEIRPGDIAVAIIFGPMVLVGTGLVCWAAGGIASVTWLARALVAVELTGIGWRIYHARAALRLPTGTCAVIGAGALLAGFGIAKANISIGAPGELYGGSISRSLEVGGHSDSRVPYHIVQVIAHHFAPFSEQANAYFSPWNFASRGPLAGIIAAPVVIATGAEVPTEMPDQPWRPFDRQGFAAYRITLIVLGSLTGWAMFGLIGALTRPAWGLFAATAMLLAPFAVHEMYFTWPKLIAAALVLVAFFLARERRLTAGLVLGLGYLFHPLAIFSAPIIAIWIVGTELPAARRISLRGTVPAIRFVAGTLVVVGVWLLVGFIGTGNTSSQGGFVGYFRMADNHSAVWATWWASRWQNFANTFLPLHLLGFNPAHESINSVYSPSPAWVRAGFLWWNTLPFALGVPLFLLATAAIASACRRAPGVAFVTVVGPALFLVTYWGAADSGLMRHCGQVLFVSVIALAVWSLAARPDRWRRAAITSFLHPACFVWRGTEIAVMAFGTTLLNGFPHWSSPFGVNDVVSLLAALVCLAMACRLLARATAPLRREFADHSGRPPS